MQKIKVKGHSVQKLDGNRWKDGQTDTQTDGQMKAIALPPVLTRSVINTNCIANGARQ